MEVTILYEDDDLIAVNKPSGLVVHADGRTTEPTLTDWIKKKYPKIEDVGEPLKIGTGETIKRWFWFSDGNDSTSVLTISLLGI